MLPLVFKFSLFHSPKCTLGLSSAAYDTDCTSCNAHCFCCKYNPHMPQLNVLVEQYRPWDGFFLGSKYLLCTFSTSVSPITWVNHHLILGDQHPVSPDFRQTSQVKLIGKFILTCVTWGKKNNQKQTVPDLGILSNKVTLSSRNTGLTSFWTPLSTVTLLCPFVANHRSGKASSMLSSKIKIAEGEE